MRECGAVPSRFAQTKGNIAWHLSGKDSGCNARGDSVEEMTLARPQDAGCGLDFWAKTTAVE
jgi:hypothetical protein